MATKTTKLTDPQRAFLRDNPFPAVVTDLRPDGSPHSTIVWVDEEDGRIVFNTAEGRCKPRHLRNDPRVSITVADPDDMYRWISVSGHAELTHDGAYEHIDRLAKKYLGKDVYPWHQEGEQRIIIRITPDKVDSYGF
jgi:PPOX class probable F420-dependent enzyme